MTTDQRRSEIVRQRRKKRRSPAQAGKSRRNATRREMPPMVSRVGMVVSPSAAQKRRGKKKTKNRRRYDVAVGTTGAEISFPAAEVPKIGWRVLSFILLAVLGFAFYWLWTSPQYTVTVDRVVVDEITRIDKETLLDQAGILNQPVFLVDSEHLSENLPAQVPALESVDVTVGLDGVVNFEAVERVPVIAWFQEDKSQASWVDMNGLIFPAIGSSQGLVYINANADPPAPVEKIVQDELGLLEQPAIELPIPEDDQPQAEIELPERLLEPSLVDGILELAKEMPAGVELIYDGEHGFGWQDPEFGWMIYFGKELDQAGLRVKIYDEIVEMFNQKERKPVLISVEYMHAPYYRMAP